jgi:hypothetical protein
MNAKRSFCGEAGNISEGKQARRKQNIKKKRARLGLSSGEQRGISTLYIHPFSLVHASSPSSRWSNLGCSSCDYTSSFPLTPFSGRTTFIKESEIQRKGIRGTCIGRSVHVSTVSYRCSESLRPLSIGTPYCRTLRCSGQNKPGSSPTPRPDFPSCHCLCCPCDQALACWISCGHCPSC